MRSSDMAIAGGTGYIRQAQKKKKKKPNENTLFNYVISKSKITDKETSE